MAKLTSLLPSLREKKSNTSSNTSQDKELADANGTYSSTEISERSDNKFSSMVIGGLEKAIQVQTSTVTKYVESLRKRNSSAGEDELQELIDKHFIFIVSGTGAGAGAAASVPGIGLITGTAAIGAESLVFIEAVAWYIIASAHLRNIPVRDPEVRRAIVLLVLTGSKGSALVDTFVQDLDNGASLSTAKALTRFSAPTLSGINGRLTKMFLSNMTKRMKWAWVSKLMPLGIGAVLGTVANRKLGQQVIAHTHQQLPKLM
ncbi:MAG: hypothetical protein SOW59_00605 [Corynebacterium sp.]|nr:hypothetical protein [Corynebacterium sp.]